MTATIELTDTLPDIMYKMSEGNPGALMVLLEIMKNGEAIDPDNALGGIGVILSIDDLGLRGPKIWMLFKDVCRQDLRKMLAVLRARQLGFASDEQVKHAAENRGDGLDVACLCAKVKARLPRFQLEELTATLTA